MSTTVDLGKITASVTVGTTTTGAAGTNASVSNSGTTQDAVLNFTIPRGAQGVQGPQGIQGNTGPAGPTGPQGPMGDVAVITPEQQAAFTMYSTTGQNTDGPMTQKAVTDNFAEIGNDLNNVDLEFADPLGNVLASFENGGVKTKEFDSSVDAPTRAAAAPYGDLEFADSEGNVLVSFENGGIKTKNFDSSDIANNPWKNKKIAWDGHSVIYGSNVDDRTKIFPYIVSTNLNAAYVNYAIGGSTLCKKPDSYEDIFYSLEEWQTATGAGLVDTTKKYLVRDGAFGAKRPYGLYSYSNGSWSAPAVADRNGENCARTPLVDRIQELPTDADLVVIGIGANDWAHEWGSLGTPYVNGVRNMDKTTVCGAMNIVCQYLTETYINNETEKRVLFITECPSFHYMEDVSVLNPYTEKWGMTYYEFVELLTEIAGNYGIPYWNIMREMGLSSYESWWVSSQDITSHRKSHPNVAGHARVAEILTRMVLQF